MRILGIDPGYERLGIAVLERTLEARPKESVVFSKCFKTSPKLEFSERLNLIGEEIIKIIKKYRPKILAIETLFLTTNQKTVMRVAEARGVVIYEAARAGLKIFDKAQINKMVKMLVKIDNQKGSDDELDAIAIALTAFAHLRN